MTKRYHITTGYYWRKPMTKPYPTTMICVDCGVNIGEIAEYYMVHDHIWAEAGMTSNGGMLCIGCLESRLDRDLTPSDFTDALLNSMRFMRSAHLRHRLGLG